MDKVKSLLLAGLCASSLVASAIPARRGPQTVTQPDGTTISICKTGDEFSHFITTADGLLLSRDTDGTWCYGRMDVSGRVTSTGIKAVDAAVRKSLPPQAMKLQEAAAVRRAAAGRPRRAIAQNGMGLYNTDFPTTGDVNVLVLLVEYKDVKFTLEHPYEYFNAMLNDEGFSQYGGTGSCKDYFRDNSNDKFRPHFDVFGPITLEKNMAAYGANDIYGEDVAPDQMVADACRLADGQIDFSRYDMDNDGYVDNVYVFYAGQAESSYGDEDTIWPHSWNIQSYLSLDGKVVSKYACSSEMEGDRPDGIGTFVHEFSHVMGLPDLYSTVYNNACTPGAYSVMDYGPYNNDGCTPPSYSIYERNALRWMEPEVIDGPMNARLENLAESNHGYIVQTRKDNEFFLFENRQQKGWDKYLPGHGMLIWHIDFNQGIWDSNEVNNTPSHQYVDLMEANNYTASNNAPNLLRNWPFPGESGKYTSFTDETIPSMRTWDNARLNLPLTEISESKDGIITFLVDGGVPKIERPKLNPETEVGDTWFVADWDAVDNATDYLISVYVCGKGDGGIVKLDMGSGSSLDLGEWTSSSADCYKSAGNYGQASPSLKLSKDGAWLESPTLPGDATAIKFWCKGQNTDDSHLSISGLAGGSWTRLQDYVPLKNKAEEVIITDIPSNVTKIRFEYKKYSGNVGIDDIEIECGESDKLLAPYDRMSTQGSTTFRVDVPQEHASSSLRYYVVATDGTDESRASEPAVVTLKTSGIGSMLTETPVRTEYYDLLGRRVLRPAKGDILIMRRGHEVRKIIIR